MAQPAKPPRQYKVEVTFTNKNINAARLFVRKRQLAPPKTVTPYKDFAMTQAGATFSVTIDRQDPGPGTKPMFRVVGYVAGKEAAIIDVPVRKHPPAKKGKK